MKRKSIILLILVIGFSTSKCSNNNEVTMTDLGNISIASKDTATFGAGCFWCTEAVFLQLKGVISVTPGYSGGSKVNPTYSEVCSGATGHAEVARIVYDTTQITFADLLEVFWEMHDPTTLNRQGADVGTQYRSAIFYHNEQQRRIADFQKNKLNESGRYDNPVVTEISPATTFYPAEDYHENYYNNNKSAPYCRIVISPKIEKIRKEFGTKTK